MSRAALLLPYARRTSQFITTRRRILAFWLASLIIIPAYLCCVHLLSLELTGNLPIPEAMLQNPAFEHSSFLGRVVFMLRHTSEGALVIRAIAAIFLWVFALAPLPLIFISPPEWSDGFNRREPVVMVAVIVLILFLGKDFGVRWHVFSFFALLIFCINLYRALNTWRWRMLLVGAGIFVIVSSIIGRPFGIFALGITVVALIIFVRLTESPEASDDVDTANTATFDRSDLLKSRHTIESFFIFILAIFFGALIINANLDIPPEGFVFIVIFAPILAFSLYYAVQRERLIQYKKAKDRTGLRRYLTYLFFISGMIVVTVALRLQGQNQWVGFAVAALLTILIASNPFYVRSYLRAALRHLTSRLRYDYLQDRSSPLVEMRNPVNRFLREQLPRFLNFDDNRTLYIILALFAGGVVIPVFWFFVQTRSGDTQRLKFGEEITPFSIETITSPDLLELLFLGLISSMIFVSIYISWWLIRNRSRYIVSRFEVIGTDTQAPELQAIANLSTFLLVDELQKIAVLLKTRQVEDVNHAREDNNIFFVTSGIDQEFVNQMQQIINIDIPNRAAGTDDSTETRFSPGGLFALLIRLLARIRVEGKVQKRNNGSIEIWVQLIRGNQAATVDHVLLPENNITEIDDYFMQPITRELALKLYIELGQVRHLGSSTESLDNFLIGLDSAVNKDWWRAIAYYRRALQVEESHRETFGIGHYHLGVALLFQGNWQEGLEHLRTAEQDGPVMGETPYMMALALLYLHWGELHRRPAVFEAIDTRIKTALSRRANFPEAHQLRGTAFYRRGRLEERRVTNAYKNQDITTTEKGTVHHYYFEEASICFRRAIRAYDRSLRRLNRPDRTMIAIHAQRDYLIRQRMTSTHQIGDALRALEHFPEATTYYRDMQQIYPHNLRNLADLAKTYALAHYWQRGEEYMWREVLNSDILRWDADIAIHMGWLLAGGVHDSEVVPLRKHTVDAAARRFYRGQHWSKSLDPVENLLKGMEFLDYAVHQRPRYITYYRQTDWYDRFDRAFKTLWDEKSSSDVLRQPLTSWYHIKALKTAQGEAQSDRNTEASTTPQSQAQAEANNSGDGQQSTISSSTVRKVAYSFSKRPVWLSNGGQIQNKATHTQILLQQMQYWLALRVDSYWMLENNIQSNQTEDSEIDDNSIINPALMKKLRCSKDGFKELLHKTSNYEGEKLWELYECLKEKREKVMALLEQVDSGKRASPMITNYRWLLLGKELFDLWQKMQCYWLALRTRQQYPIYGQEHPDDADDNIQEEKLPNLLDRWIIDVYLEISLLTVRTMAEAEAFEYVFYVSDAACVAVEHWMAWWQKIQEYAPPLAQKYDQPAFTFSPRVVRYQHCSILSWRAYAKYQLYCDPVASARLMSEISESMSSNVISAEQEGHIPTTNRAEIGTLEHNLYKVFYHPETGKARTDFAILNDIHRDIEMARQHIDNHPLTLFVLAKLQRRRGLHEQAVEEYERLIDLISPYDPKQNLGAVFFQNTTDYTPRRRDPNKSFRHFLYYMERISGRQQFYGLIDLPLIHMELAETYLELNKPELRVRHLSEAVRWSPYDDLDLTNFLRLANQHIQLEHYDEALAVLEAVNIPVKRIGRLQLSMTRNQLPALLTAMIQTRSRKFGLSMQIARNLARQLTLDVYARIDKDLTLALEEGISRTENPEAASHHDSFKALFEDAHSILTERAPEFYSNVSLYHALRNTIVSGQENEKQSLEEYDSLLKKKPTLAELLAAFLALNRQREDSEHHQTNSKATGKNHLIRFWSLFENISIESVENAALYAQPALSKRSLKQTIKWVQEKYSDPFDRIIVSQMIYLLSREYSTALSQFAEVSNILAYNRAEESLKLEHAFTDSATAVMLMFYLMHQATEGGRERAVFARKLAQYCDTFGWVRYRHALRATESYEEQFTPLSEQSSLLHLLLNEQKSINPAKLQGWYLVLAHHYFRLAVRYNQNHSMMHYHLARLYLTSAELIWQQNPRISHDDKMLAAYARNIDSYLNQALREWRLANQQDRYKRLHGDLTWLYNRISQTKQAWEHRQLQGLAGAVNKTLI